MKRYLVLCLLFGAIACSKDESREEGPPVYPKVQSDDRNWIPQHLLSFDKREKNSDLMRATEEALEMRRFPKKPHPPKGPKNPQPPPDTTNPEPPGDTTDPDNPPPVSSVNILYCDWNGHYVTQDWTVGGNFAVDYSGLSADEIVTAMDRIVEAFAQFDVTVTMDSTLYHSAQVGNRARLVITEDWEWYGQAGGVAYVGSFNWSRDVAGFVFSSLLGYSVKMISDASIHELGHTLGLHHQGRCNGEAYRTDGPHMGAAYYVDSGFWCTAAQSLNCYPQDDFVIITATLADKGTALVLKYPVSFDLYYHRPLIVLYYQRKHFKLVC